MKTIFKLVASVGTISAVLLFNGCTGSNPKPKYNPNSKRITFFEGKPYLVPYGIVVTGGSLSAKSARNTRKLAGMDCRTGDLEWHEKEDLAKWEANLKEGKTNYEEAMADLGRAYREGKAGCERPLSDKEYKYYLNQQNQQAANYRATATRNYNVTHSGTVYHY